MGVRTGNLLSKTKHMETAKSQVRSRTLKTKYKESALKKMNVPALERLMKREGISQEQFHAMNTKLLKEANDKGGMDAVMAITDSDSYIALLLGETASVVS